MSFAHPDWWSPDWRPHSAANLGSLTNSLRGMLCFKQSRELLNPLLAARKIILLGWVWLKRTTIKTTLWMVCMASVVSNVASATLTWKAANRVLFRSRSWCMFAGDSRNDAQPWHWGNIRKRSPKSMEHKSKKHQMETFNNFGSFNNFRK